MKSLGKYVLLFGAMSLACGKVGQQPCRQNCLGPQGGAGGSTPATVSTGGATTPATVSTGGATTPAAGGASPSTGGTIGTGGSSSSTVSTGGTTKTGTPDAGASDDAASQCPTGTGMGLPWFVPAPAQSTGGSSGEGGAGGSGGAAADAGLSSCASLRSSDGQTRTSCSGTARVSGSPDAPKLLFDDGSELDYNSKLAPTLAIPALGSGKVRVRYEWRQAMDCPYCGSRSEAWVEIRTADGSQLLFAGSDSDFGGMTNGSTLNEVLGAMPVAEAGCSYSTTWDCHFLDRSELNHVVPTTPPIRLPHAQVTRVTSPSGVAYDVMISLSSDVIRPNPNCADGREVSADSTYLVSRVTE